MKLFGGNKWKSKSKVHLQKSMYINMFVNILTLFRF